MMAVDEAAVDGARGYFADDASAHRQDAPRHCPGCGALFAVADGGQGIATEYWAATDRVFVCFCGACGWAGDIVLSSRVVGHEPED